VITSPGGLTVPEEFDNFVENFSDFRRESLIGEFPLFSGVLALVVRFFVRIGGVAVLSSSSF